MKEQYVKWVTDIGFYPITNGLWQSFKVLHQPPTNIEQRKEVERYIKKNTGKSNGLYIYQHSSGDIIYIGKGKPIASRLISHYVESFQPVRGDTKDKKWHRFFKNYQGELTVYWKELEEEYDRRIVETILHQIIKPKFIYFDKQIKVDETPVKNQSNDREQLDNRQRVLSILDSFSELKRKIISQDRINYYLIDSAGRERTIVVQISKTGNGYVKCIDLEPYKHRADERGYLSIRGMDENELKNIVRYRIESNRNV